MKKMKPTGVKWTKRKELISFYFQVNISININIESTILGDEYIFIYVSRID